MEKEPEYVKPPEFDKVSDGGGTGIGCLACMGLFFLMMAAPCFLPYDKLTQGQEEFIAWSYTIGLLLLLLVSSVTNVIIGGPNPVTEYLAPYDTEE